MSKVKSYNKAHLKAWAFDLEKHGHISCFLQKCPFIAFDLPEIISHYRNCKGGGVFEFTCQYCQKATDKLYKLNNHILLSHESEAPPTTDEMEYQYKADGDKTPEEIPKVMKDVWRLFLDIKGYLKCLIPVCRYLAENITDMENHYLTCTGNSTAKQVENVCDICHGSNPDPSVIALHREQCHSKDTAQPLDVNFISLQLRHAWQKELQDSDDRIARCVTVGCRYASLTLKDIKQHYTYCRSPVPERYVPCEHCETWWDNPKVKKDHCRNRHQIDPLDGPVEQNQRAPSPNKMKRKRITRKKVTEQEAGIEETEEQDPLATSVKITSDGGLSWKMDMSGVKLQTQLDFSFDGICERIFASDLALLESSYRLRHYYYKQSLHPLSKATEHHTKSKAGKKALADRRKLKGPRGTLGKGRRKRVVRKSRLFFRRDIPSDVKRGPRTTLRKQLNDNDENPNAARESSPVTNVTNMGGDANCKNSCAKTETKIKTYSRRKPDNGVSSAAVWPLVLTNELRSTAEDEISIRDLQNMSTHTLESSFDNVDAEEIIDDITSLLNGAKNCQEPLEVLAMTKDCERICHDVANALSDGLRKPDEVCENFTKGADDSVIKFHAKSCSKESGNSIKKRQGFLNFNNFFDFEFFSHRVGLSFVVCPLYDTVQNCPDDSNRQTDESANDETPRSINETEPVRRRGRPRRKVVEESAADAADVEGDVQELGDSGTVKVEAEEDEEMDADAGAESPVPAQRRSTRRKRGRVSVRKEETEEAVDNQDSSLDTSISEQPVTTKRRKALPYDDIRINYFTKLKNPNDQVKCGVCSETMTAKEYQSRHLQHHSYICWLEGEPPMDNEDEDVLARYLYRVYIKGKNVIFTCEKCNETKKSAKGFVTHRALCGKTGAEVDQVMAKCGLCGRVVMPYCLESHMMAKHSKRSDEDGETDESQGRKVRLAASKCLKTLSTITSKPEYHSPLRGKQDPDAPSFNSDNDGEGDVAIDDADLAYSVVKRRTTKILKTLWGTSLKADQEAKCMVRGCDYSTNRMKSIIRHYQSCTVEPLEYKCRECTFQSFSRDVVLKHVKTNHEDLADEKKVVARLSRNGGTVSGIPFVTQAESRLPSTCSFFYEAVRWTHELRKKCIATDTLYGDCDFKSTEWVPLDAAEAKPYLPRQSKSMKFFVGKSVEQKEWNIIQTFEAHRGSGDAVTTLFCGGPLSSMAWAPVEGPQQYLALSTDLSMDQPRTVKDVSPAPGSVQIWSATRSPNTNEPQDVKLEYILCHDEGSRAWDMKWCPGGCQNERRMGMLALATSSGVIPIYSLPWPALLPDLGRRIKTFKPSPVFGLVLDSERAQCTAVSWSQVKPHRILAAGFTNGIVALWDLTQESQLLKRANNLLPFKVINAHSHVVTSVALSPTSEDNFVSSARDKIIKCWDVKDTTCPQSQNHRGTAMNVDWVYSWMSSALIIDSVSSSFPSTTVLLYPYRYVAHQTNIICGTLIDSTPLGLSVNSWINAILTSYDNGQVSLVFARNQVNPRDERKKFVKIIIQPELHDFRPGNLDCNTYAKASEKFGVTFFTDTLADHSQRLKKNPPNPVNAYPVLTANKVAWNPNPGSVLNFAVGYQSGFVLITDVSLSQTDQKFFNNAFAAFVVKRDE